MGPKPKRINKQTSYYLIKKRIYECNGGTFKFINTSNLRARDLEIKLFKTTVLSLCFWVLLRKALEEFLNLLYVLVILGILKFLLQRQSELFYMEYCFIHKGFWQWER